MPGARAAAPEAIACVPGAVTGRWLVPLELVPEFTDLVSNVHGRAAGKLGHPGLFADFVAGKPVSPKP